MLTTAIATLTVGSLRTPSSPRRFPRRSLRPSPMEASSSRDGDTATAASDRTVTILQRGPRHVVAYKPPAVLSHHSGWAGSRSNKAAKEGGELPEVPMLQRVRDALHDIDTRGVAAEGADGKDGNGDDAQKRRVNLVHRLDRGASGCLLLTYADDEDGGRPASSTMMGDTAQLIDAMSSDESIKTYVALVRGEGMLRGENLVERGWFEVSRPIKDDVGETKDATTLFNFVAGQAEAGPDRPRMSLVLAKPKEGRFHQIRKHLAGLSHPILGDNAHGHSKTNR
ncbi:hypothetical protein THAOC_19242, partial [Thalassiosira oceanica]